MAFQVGGATLGVVVPRAVVLHADHELWPSQVRVRESSTAHRKGLIELRFGNAAPQERDPQQRLRPRPRTLTRPMERRAYCPHPASCLERLQPSGEVGPGHQSRHSRARGDQSVGGGDQVVQLEHAGERHPRPDGVEHRMAESVVHGTGAPPTRHDARPAHRAIVRQARHPDPRVLLDPARKRDPPQICRRRTGERLVRSQHSAERGESRSARQDSCAPNRRLQVGPVQPPQWDTRIARLSHRERAPRQMRRQRASTGHRTMRADPMTVSALQGGM